MISVSNVFNIPLIIFNEYLTAVVSVIFAIKGQQ